MSGVEAASARVSAAARARKAFEGRRRHVCALCSPSPSPAHALRINNSSPPPPPPPPSQKLMPHLAHSASRGRFAIYNSPRLSAAAAAADDTARSVASSSS